MKPSTTVQFPRVAADSLDLKKQSLPLAKVIELITQRSFLYLVSAEVLIVGAWLESQIGNDWFARSGAFLTILALIMLWIWVLYSEQLRVNRMVFEAVKRQKGRLDTSDPQVVYNRLKSTRPDIDTLELIGLAIGLSAIADQGPKLLSQLGSVTSRLAIGQVEMAIVGTIVWAFGDLFPNWYFLVLASVLPLLWSVKLIVGKEKRRNPVLDIF